jgi:excisionase family DNA binding protein
MDREVHDPEVLERLTFEIQFRCRFAKEHSRLASIQRSGHGTDLVVERWRTNVRPSALKGDASSRRRVNRIERPRTVSEAAEELGLSVHTIRAWIASRRLGHLRLGRAIRIPAAEIRRVLEESLVPAEKER